MVQALRSGLFLLFCWMHSSLMTGKLQKKGPYKHQSRKTNLNLSLLLRRPDQKKSCDLQHNICDPKASWDTCYTWDVKMSNPGQMKGGEAETRKINGDLRRLNDEGVVFSDSGWEVHEELQRFFLCFSFFGVFFDQSSEQTERELKVWSPFLSHKNSSAAAVNSSTAGFSRQMPFFKVVIISFKSSSHCDLSFQPDATPSFNCWLLYKRSYFRKILRRMRKK